MAIFLHSKIFQFKRKPKKIREANFFDFLILKKIFDPGRPYTDTLQNSILYYYNFLAQLEVTNKFIAVAIAICIIE